MSEQCTEALPAQYERLHVGIILYDPKCGDVVDANGRLESLFGYATARLRALTIDQYSANTGAYRAEQMRERLQKAANGSPQQFRWRVKRADGELIWVRMHLSEHDISGTTYVLAEVFDITDHYIASRRLGLFSRLLRHNLRNDVSVIAGRAECIQTRSDRTQVHRDAEKIQRTAMDVGRLTESVKEIEQATTRTIADQSRRNATEAVTTVAERFRETHPSANIVVEEREQMWMRVDDAFTHALSHAIENAIVHDPKPAPTVQITIGTSPNTGRLEIRIVDTAPPIPDVEIDALDEFTDTTSTSHGSGTGLFVMKWCIESLGGELTFERQSEGNVVTLYLPPKEPPELTPVCDDEEAV